MKQILSFFLLLTIVFSLSACYTVPETGRSSLALLPESILIEQSKAAFAEMKRDKPISYDPAENERVQRVGRRIAAAVADQMPNVQWEFVVFDDPQLNAFAMPGGKVGVFNGMLKLTKSDDELAAVMSHELAHVIARHSNDQMTKKLIMVGLGLTADKVMEKKEVKYRKAIMALYGGVGTVGSLYFSRSHESEADQMGVFYMARAGYNPRASITLWQKMIAEGSGGGNMPEWLSTHPKGSSRIRNLERHMPSAMAEYEYYKTLY